MPFVLTLRSVDWIRLSKDNFTPLTRTPWGGECIAQMKGLLPQRVGESWELSLGPEFPSETLEGPLMDVINRDPSRWLGSHPPSLLVKLLDTSQELSVQIHPADDDPALKSDESGKPESWYITDHKEGAGIYLGLRDGVSLSQMRQALAEQGDIEELLYFVPVEVGDFFIIDAGTAHAIGAGLTLIEPQRVQAGKRGLTYRYWDWNRRYANGILNPNGTPRALHVERALAVTDWHAPRQEAMLKNCRVRSGSADRNGSITCEPLVTPQNAWSLGAWRLTGCGDLTLPPFQSLCALTVVDGAVVLRGSGHSERFEKGESVAVAASTTLSMVGEGLHALLSTAI